MSENNKYKDMMKPKAQGSVYDHFLGPIEKSEEPSEDHIPSNSETTNDKPYTDTRNKTNTNVNVNLVGVPVAKRKRGIRETHTTKAFYIRNDIAMLINEDIRKERGAMTEIVNALFEQYYRRLGRLK